MQTSEYELLDDPLGAGMTVVRRTSDGAFIPVDERNADYQQYLVWKESQTENQ